MKHLWRYNIKKFKLLPILSKIFENSLSVEFLIPWISSPNLASNSGSSSLNTRNSSMFKSSSVAWRSLSKDLLMLTCSLLVAICLFSNSLMLGRDTSNADNRTTIRQVDGVAFDVEDLQIKACSLFTWAIRVRFCLWSSLTLCKRFLFSSEPRFTLKQLYYFRKCKTSM